MSAPSATSTVLLVFLSLSFIFLLCLLISPNEFRLQSLISTAQCTQLSSSGSTMAVVQPPQPEPELRLLIGILTLPDLYERRNLVRHVYALQQAADQDHAAQIDVRFVFCNLTKEEQQVLVAMEIMLYDDIIILDCSENMDGGKTYTYFSSLPRIFGRRPYDYVMKTDDDTYFRLNNLAGSLRKMPREDLYYGFLNPCDPSHPLRYMSGMGYVLSWDLVEWISTSAEVGKHTAGPEDLVTGRWLRDGGRGKNRFDMNPAMYDYMNQPKTCYRHEFVSDTIAVHKLKNNLQWARTLKYFNVTKALKASKLYHIY